MRRPATWQSVAVSVDGAWPQRGIRTANHHGPGRELREVPATDQAIRASTAEPRT
jgi:hypothetical protein